MTTSRYRIATPQFMPAALVGIEAWAAAGVGVTQNLDPRGGS